MSAKRSVNGINNAVEVSADALPDGARQGIKHFLVGHHVPEQRRYIVWHVDRATHQGEELEFDAIENRYLSLSERLAELPAPHSFELDGYTVVATYRLKPPENELYAQFEIFEPGAATKLTEADQAIYTCTHWTVDEVVAEAIEKANFPKTYAAWDEETKVGYWAQWLHRWRRSSGECGNDEDDAFCPEMREHMQRIDPDLRERLRPILSLTARLGQVEPQELFESFAKRADIEF